MPWWRAEGSLPRHAKIHVAGQQFGAGGAGRVLALYAVANMYAVDSLTDGFVPPWVFDDRRFDRKPAEVIEAMVAVNLLERVEGGFQIHDFDEYNPKAEEWLETVAKKAAAGREGGRRSGEARRRLAASKREAKSKQVLRENEANGKQNRSKRQANAKPIRSEEDQDQEQRAPRAALSDDPAGVPEGPLVIDDNPRALEKLAHTLLDELDAGVLQVESHDELEAAFEQRAARLRLRYDGDRTRKAIESAIAQRRKRA